MPTPDELAAQIRQWAEEGKAIADEVAALDDTPTPDPEPEPQPEPEPVDRPAKPTGLACVIGPDARPQLSWDDPGGVDEWDVRDELNLAKPVQATVTEPRSVRSALKPGQRRRYTVVARNEVGDSPASDALAVPPGEEPNPEPAAVRYAGDIVGLNWYLTLPTGRQGSPDTVHQPALATYSSKYFELTPEHDGVVFRCWHGGVTTSGSLNPRTELREETNGGTAHATWNAGDGLHSLTVVGQVNRLTRLKPHVVLHQIHGATDDVTVWRLEGTRLWITAGDNPHAHLVDGNYQLGQRYELTTFAEDGALTYFYNGQQVSYTAWSTDPGCYFKAGCYLQSNPKSAPGESTSEYAEVVINSVHVQHEA